MPSGDEDALEAQVNAAMTLWSQGDFVLGDDLWFAFGDAAADGAHIGETSVLGFAVTTQTCDLVRNSSTRPWVEVSPLIAVSDLQVEQARLGIAIQLGYLPMLASRRLVADLDRTMTFHKRVVSQWKREPAGLDDLSTRSFAKSLARKRARKAFPDDFTALVGKMRDHIKAKHGKESHDGQGLVDLREIRVTASPTWDSPTIELTFWFIWNEWTDLSRENRASAAARWCEKVKASGRYVSVTHVGCLLSDLRADEYVHADRLDLDYLSASKEAASS